MSARTRQVVRTVLVTSFLVAVGIAAAGVVIGHTEEMAELLGRTETRWYLALALTSLIASLLLGVQTWRKVLAALGSPLGFTDGARVCFAAIAGTYLPGPWWQAMAAAHIGRRTGIAARRVVAGYLLVAVVNLLSATTVGLLVAPLVVGANWAWLAVPLMVGGYVVWRPASVLRLTDRAARMLRRGPLVEQAAPGGIRQAMLFQSTAWLIGGLHLWLLAVALGAPPAETLSIGVGAYALASAAGALTLVLPDGAGVRELVIIVALSSVLPVPVATLAAIGSRLCVIAAQALCACGLALVVWSRQTATSSPLR